jgi:hypothetical protein
MYFTCLKSLDCMAGHIFSLLRALTSRHAKCCFTAYRYNRYLYIITSVGRDFPKDAGNEVAYIKVEVKSVLPIGSAHNNVRTL